MLALNTPEAHAAVGRSAMLPPLGASSLVPAICGQNVGNAVQVVQASLRFARVPPRTPNPWPEALERGNQVVGANPTVKPWEAQALLALARQLTPQANERGSRFAGTSLWLSASQLGGSAHRGACGGVGSRHRQSLRRHLRQLGLLDLDAHLHRADKRGRHRGLDHGRRHHHGGWAQPKQHLHTAPITARTSSLVYKGPVYEKAATGQIVPYTPPPPAGTTNGVTGGSSVDLAANAKPELLVPGATARYVKGLAAAPMSAPAAVQQIIWAGNQLIGLPYIYGGGHGSFISPGYDCSGTVSFALHGADLIPAPMDSSEFMGWGEHGVGQWVTVFSNPEHAYMTVAGLRLDTSPADDPSDREGPRWRPLRPENSGFMKRHPIGL